MPFRSILRSRSPGGPLAALVGTRLCPILETTDASVAIDALSQLIARDVGVDAETIARTAWRRELVVPTVLRTGLAIPRARVEGVRSTVGALGIARRGLSFPDAPGVVARIVVLIVAPPEPSLELVRALTTVLDAFGREEARDALLGATTSHAAVTELVATL